MEMIVYMIVGLQLDTNLFIMSLRAIARQPRRMHIERDEVASSFLLAMTRNWGLCSLILANTHPLGRYPFQSLTQ
nr:hypothetical protein [Mucilaginibacter sp. X5P1]